MRSIAIRPKVYLAVLVGLAAAYLLPATISGNFRTAIAVDAGAIIYLVFSLYLMQACGAPRCAGEPPCRTTARL